MAGLLDVILRRHAGDHDIGALSQLLGSAQYNLGVAVVVLDCSLNFDLPSFKPADVSHFFYISREHDHGERARFYRVAEGQKSGALAAMFDVKHGAADTLGRAHVLVRVRKW